MKSQFSVPGILPGKSIPLLQNVKNHRYDTIQVFRFVAALMVIILHSTFYTSERLVPGSMLYHEGANGVRLFFVISGFVMIISSENLKTMAGGWKIFAIKRIVRIVPIYWIITTYKLLILIVASSLVLHSKLDLSYIAKSYFFLPAKNVDGELLPLLGVGWSLNFEMFFYVLFTVALAFRINAVGFLAAVFIPLFIISFFRTPAWPDAGFYANQIVLDFLYGMIAAKLILNKRKVSKTLATVFILAGLFYLFFPKTDTLAVIYTYDGFFIGIAAFLVVYGSASIEEYLQPKIPSWLVYMGGASYSLYLIHPIVAPLAPTILNRLHLKSYWLSVSLSVGIALLAGAIFYKFCEKPLTKIISKWTRKNKIQPAQPIFKTEPLLEPTTKFINSPADDRVKS